MTVASKGPSIQLGEVITEAIKQSVIQAVYQNGSVVTSMHAVVEALGHKGKNFALALDISGIVDPAKPDGFKVRAKLVPSAPLVPESEPANRAERRRSSRRSGSPALKVAK